MRFAYRIVTGVAGVALLAGTAACGGDEKEESSHGGDSRSDGGGDGAGTVEALQAAAENTADVRSARFEGEMNAPEAAGGQMTLEGVMSWDPTLTMEMTTSGGELASTPGAPEEVAVRWIDDVMYMHMGPEFGAEMDGREWLSMDLNAVAEIAGEAGDPAMADAMTMGLESTNQNPAQQMGLLLNSPGIEEVGEETLNGVETRHYAGTVTIEDAVAGDQGGVTELLTEEEVEQLVAAMEQQGIESYDIDVWIDGDDMPVQVRQSYDTVEGPVEYEVRYSDFNTDVSVDAPPADAVLDFMELLADMGAEL
ncbi:hypothetical protein SAMN06297387_10441 [Streptomyces zhaozhouensis]|uniref:Lipoprotein n=1 Tax=Streptomyces zhaozhouensis TaxID=1300267 RepID=A0A286DT88_9ACTN|nr:hypothetical protein [Streptomyces zhaozhouensis]SOD61871.1 hypothetical protein SAMN06297387_10441 [Streptomyces zhaozhouensis]